MQLETSFCAFTPPLPEPLTKTSQEYASLLPETSNSKNGITRLIRSSSEGSRRVTVKHSSDFIGRRSILSVASTSVESQKPSLSESLHVSEYPRRVESDKMSGIMGVGSSVLLRIKDVNSSMKVELSMRERGLKALDMGRIIEITPTKVPRIIGHGGSMVSMLKKETNCEIFVGQNGRIWINGETENINLVLKAIDIIEKESHKSGLTNKIISFLKEEKDKSEYF